ncbi:hypothetical protein DXA36_15135 [Eisenbergiella sp. OF01-20]|nr:hypothetical protein DXA36_15135 [Eisenbergiella sp. OF01-20]
MQGKFHIKATRLKAAEKRVSSPVLYEKRAGELVFQGRFFLSETGSRLRTVPGDIYNIPIRQRLFMKERNG